MAKRGMTKKEIRIAALEAVTELIRMGLYAGYDFTEGSLPEDRERIIDEMERVRDQLLRKKKRAEDSQSRSNEPGQ